MCFRFGSEDNFIVDFPKLDTSDKKVHWNTKSPKMHTYILTKIDETSEKNKDEIDPQNIYPFMERMYSNAESPRRDYRTALN